MNKSKNPIAWILTFALLLSLVSAMVSPQATMKSKAASYGLSNPTIDSNGVTTWDVVCFGHYAQSDLTGTKKDAIRWRVLSVEGNDAFLLADQNLDSQPYNTRETGVSWKECTLRAWLNSSFFSTAFTNAEQAIIKDSQVQNDNNPDYNTEAGDNTNDHVFLLSLAEIKNESYGFNRIGNVSSETREAMNTPYAKTQGAFTSNVANYAGNGTWWLRSPGDMNIYASFVDASGIAYSNGCIVNDVTVAVRPAIHIDLSAVSLWSNGGKVKSNGEVATPTTPTPTPPASTTPTPKLIPKKNTTKTLGTLKYKITKSSAKNGAVAVVGIKSKKAKKATIPSTIKINGYTFKVSSIAAKAFYQCKNLKKLTIKSSYITTIGKNAIKKVNKKLVVKVPKKKLKKYKKLFNKKAGWLKSMKII